MGKTQYKVQIGAYRQKANADKMVAKLKKAGIPAAVVTAGDLMKVQCGAFTVKANADKRLEEVKKKGFLNAVIVTVPGTDPEPAAVKTGWKKVLAVLERIMAAKDPHQKVIDILKKHGNTLKASSAWCSETVVAAFLEAGLVNLIGGYTTNAPSLKKHAKTLGIWHSGSSGIKAGDIVLYGSGEPNHTEIAIDGTYNISGNYNGTVKKRKRAGRTINGYIRPKYPEEKKEDPVPAPEPGHPKVRFWGIRLWESDPEKYGDASVFIQYAADGKTIDHVLLVDTGMNDTDTVKKLQAAGVKKIDAILISHDHSDHYGFLETILNKFTVGHVYFPDQDGVKKYQPGYADRIAKQAAKCAVKKVPYSYLKPGDSFTVGVIVCNAIFQADASKLPEKETHHFINNMSIAVRIIVNGTWVFHMAGDMQSDAIKQMLAAMPADRLKCDVFKIQWHGDRGAVTIDLAKTLKPAVALSNYHNKSSHGGRNSTYKALEDNAGTLVMKNYEDGEVYMDMQAGTMVVSGSKTGMKKTITKTMPATRWSAYKAALSAKQEPKDVKAGMLLAIEPEDYTKAEIAELKAAGATVLGYLSVGSISDERDCDREMKAYALDPLQDWPHEKYLDIRRTAAREFLAKRAKEIKAMGFDGWWLDNLDVYEEYKSDAMHNAIKAILTSIKALGGYVMVNGGIEYLQKAMDADSGHAGLGNIDGVTQEEVFSLITDYSGSGTFDTQSSKMSSEYQSHMKRVIRHKMQAFLLEYTKDNTLKLRISAFCTTTGAIACISGDVNL
ncbi:MAG: endo alpha-1,4 polygalactosaminidase [Lachnospiraceae bacterium]|nr:endo alpha-1,4 polygalactosaminidase [Lachnospiraceae bacterium]